MGRLNGSLKALRLGLARIGYHLRRSGAAYGVLLISLLLTALAYLYVRQNVEAQTRARFDEITQATQEAIERRTQAYLDAMLGARGLFYASRSVTRGEWDNYVEGIEPGNHFEGLQALSYAERVEPEEREAFARRLQEEGLPEIRPDLDPGGERSVYFPTSSCWRCWARLLTGGRICRARSGSRTTDRATALLPDKSAEIVAYCSNFN